MQSAFRATVSGRVQMVMFRDFVQRKASELKLVGFVRNLPDGNVEVCAEGEKDALDALVSHLHTGPILARVDGVSVSWPKPTGQYKEFTIQYP